MISITHLAGNEWQVTLKSGVTTHHHVRVTQADLDRFAVGRSVEDLLRESFGFLLELESNTSILGSFDLPVINRYFPDYEIEIHKRLGEA